jgi:hypothetical protein
VRCASSVVVVARGVRQDLGSNKFRPAAVVSKPEDAERLKYQIVVRRTVRIQFVLRTSATAGTGVETGKARPQYQCRGGRICARGIAGSGGGPARGNKDRDPGT